VPLARLLLLGLPELTLAQTPTFRIDTQLVEVPVVVRDRKSGAAVTGLTAKDFLLLENGKPQPIAFFSANPSSGPLTATVAPPGAASNRATSDAAPLVAILIDGFNARFEDQYYAAEAAARVIEQPELPARLGLYFLGRQGLRILHDYSANRPSLLRELRARRAAGGTLAELGRGSEFTIISAPSAEARRAAGDALQAEEELRLRTTLSSLGAIGRHLSALPGRKSLVWLSAGFSQRTLLSRLPHLWSDTLTILNDANVAVYTIDSQGVRTSAGYLAESSSRDVVLRPRLGSPMADTQVLSSLAEATGGLAYLNSNALDQSLRQAIQDSSVYYRLAYRSRLPSPRGSTISLRVKLPGQRGVTPGYRRTWQTRASVASRSADRDGLLADAIVSPLLAGELGLTARLLPNQSLVRLTCVPGPPTFLVRCVQASAQLDVLDDFTDQVTLGLPATAEGLHYEMKFARHPRARLLKIAVLDPATGRLGSLQIELP
jgi:VWFA-related protein